MATKTFVSEVLKRGVEIPDKPAYIFLGNNGQRTVFTFSDVVNLSQKFAARLRSLGINRGDVVCNTLPSSPERLITHLGTIMAGAVAMVGQICRADGSDFMLSLQDGRARAVIYDPNCLSGTYAILQKAITNEINKNNEESYRLATLIPCVVKSTSDSERCLIEELEHFEDTFCEDNGEDSVCAYMCTSGSTGNFKLLPYTSKRLMDGSYEFAHNIGINKDSVVFNDKPFGWVVGTPSIVFMLGCTRVVVDESVDRKHDYPRFVTEALRRESCTLIMTTPAFLEDLLNRAPADECEDRYLLKSIGVLGAPMTKKVLKAIGILTEKLVILYGSTETYSLAALSLTSKDQEYTDNLCGHPIVGVEIKVVDSKLKDVPVGRFGEILIKKPTACSGYINNAKATQEIFLRDGWIRLGDMGCLNKKGQIIVSNRRSYAIMRGDDIIYPGQLETPLLQCPGVDEVLITGVPDEAKLEEVCALLVRHPRAGKEVDEDYVRKFCRERLFVIPENPEYDPMPKYFCFVDAIPKLANGKEDRMAAKQLAINLIF